jgi:hypothetical protein
MKSIKLIKAGTPVLRNLTYYIWKIQSASDILLLYDG